MWRLRIRAMLSPAGVLAACFLAASVSSAAETPEESSRVSASVGAKAGIRRLRPETWGLVPVNVVNSGDEPADVVAMTHFGDDASLQYARRLWVPAGAKRYSWCPVLMPGLARPVDIGTRDVLTKTQLKWLLYDRTDGKDVPVRDPTTQVVDWTLLPVLHTMSVTALVCDSTTVDPAEALEDEVVLETVSAARVSALQSPGVADLFESFLPPIVEALDGLDHLVLASDRLASDPAALAAVRRWLLGGGRLWIMLDRVDPAVAELLLGDGFRCRVVDRVGLTRVFIEGAADVYRFDAEPCEFEQPVELVRVLAPEADVTYTVNGWPAAFWHRVGDGEVLFTTLGAEAWIRPAADPPARAPRPRSHRAARPSAQEPSDAAPPVARKESDAGPWVATRALQSLSGRLCQAPPLPLLEPRQFEPYLAEQIGYRIVSRGFVVKVLGAFCLVLLAAGLWLARTRRLERMAWIGPLAAASAALALVVAGALSRSGVPPTVAVAQLAEVDSKSDAVRTTGLLAMYHRQTSSAPVGARRGGMFRPDMTGLDGTTRRMLWTDLDAWHWERLPLPPGVRTAPLVYTSRVARPIEARATFGPEGLSGTLDMGPFEAPADVMIAAPSRLQVSVAPDAEGAFHAGVDDVLTPGQYIAAGVLSDEQRRRQSIYSQLFRRTERMFPDRPTLLAWTRPLDMRFTFPAEAQRVGSALVAVPLEIEPTPAGTRVAIPSPFLDYRSVRGPFGEISAAYGNGTREWIELRVSSKVCLRFQVPAEVLPVRLDRARLTARINAPSREVEALGFAGQRAVSLKTWDAPIGTLRVEITDAELLQLDDDGGLLLAITAGADPSTGPNEGLVKVLGSAWKIESVELEVTGETLEPDA